MKRFKSVLKDEQGLTLVELLAVVVILAVILGIAAVGIGGVIQNAREDAQVSNIRQIVAAARMAEAQNTATDSKMPDTTAEALIDQGYLKATDIKVPSDIEVKVVSVTTGTAPNTKTSEVLQVTIKVGALAAGTKTNNAEKTYNETNLKNMTRSDFDFKN